MAWIVRFWGAIQVMKSEKDEAGLDNPWLALPFLAIYGFPWLFHPPSERERVTAVIVLPLFMILFVLGYRARARHGLICALGMGLLAVVAVRTTSTAAVLFIFAAALIGRSPPRRVAPYGLGTLIAAVALVGVWDKAVPWQWLPLVFVCALVGYYSYTGASLQGRNRWLVASRAEAERMAAQVERDRLTRDLHDLLGRSLTLIAVKAELAGRMIDGDAAQAGREIADIRLSAREALREIRQVVSGTPRLSLAGEIGRARTLLATLGIYLDAPASLPELPAPVDETLAYIAREAVTNVVRHAGPCDVRIALEYDDQTVRLTISDTGRSHYAVDGNGLSGMRGRAEALGGRFSMGRDRGTQVRVELPVTGVTR